MNVFVLCTYEDGHKTKGLIVYESQWRNLLTFFLYF
ncbi:hypothetical protein C8C85_1218 [Flavobacterium sp. 103]|nr:hypothetical protein C8C85_1218 [Flavobacterium sp. 103]